MYIYYYYYYYYSALGLVWAEPESNQATGMALVRCILGKFLGVVCHCIPPPFLVQYFFYCKNIMKKHEEPS
jgi:hypothetical protein